MRVPSERRYGVLRLRPVACAASCCSSSSAHRARRLLLDVARAADAGARQHRRQRPLPGLPRRLARRRHRQVPQVPRAHRRAAARAQGRARVAQGARQAVRAVPHRPQGARTRTSSASPRSAASTASITTRSPPFALEGKHQTTKCNDCHKEKTQSGTLHVSEGADGVRELPQQPARRPAREHAPLRALPRRQDVAHARQRAVRSRSRHALSAREEARARSSARPATSRRSRAQPPNSKSPVPPTNAAGYQKLTFRWPTWGFDCTPCHDNVHGTSLFGQKACKLCHSAKVEFTRINFDHNRRTRFPLDGVHADPKKAPCYGVPPEGAEDASRRARCDGCHKDVHQARFAKVSNGNDCGVCHTAANWPTDLQASTTARTPSSR